MKHQVTIEGIGNVRREIILASSTTDKKRLILEVALHVDTKQTHTCFIVYNEKGAERTQNYESAITAYNAT
ncbi:MAG: hypothetical protein KAS32_30095 [Candidatus Peribacteraceae bacterium]|nr:hypothetical protein [Candidatus Peribacteraceae bacterium]